MLPMNVFGHEINGEAFCVDLISDVKGAEGEPRIPHEQHSRKCAHELIRYDSNR